MKLFLSIALACAPLFPSVAVAQSSRTGVGTGVSDSLAPTWPKIGYEFRSGLTYDDRGFSDSGTGSKPKNLATMTVERAKLKFTGDLAPDVAFFVRLAFEPTAKQALDYAMLTLRLDEHWSVGSGKTWNYISGYEWPNSLAEYVGAGAFPFTMGATTVLGGYSKQTFELAHRGDMTWRLQIFDDVKLIADDAGTRTGGGYFSTGTQPAGSLSLQMSSLAGTAWKPLLQAASYDAGHSTIVSLGAQYKEGPWLAYVQTAVDFQGHIKDGEKSTHQRSYANGLVEYAYSDWTPFFRWQWFDVKQGKNNLTGNSFNVDEVSGVDDNLSSMSIGGRMVRFGERFMPYAAVAASRGQFQDQSGVGPTSPRSLIQLKAGVISRL